MEGTTREELTVEVDERRAQQVKDRLRLVERVTGLSPNEVAKRYLNYGLAHHEEAIHD